MKYFPISIDITDRLCIVIGGGNVAERKVQALLSHDGTVRVISPELTEGLATQARAGDFEWISRGYRSGDLERAFLVIAATDDPEIQQAVHGEAEENNILLNVADVPKWCNFILPATHRQGDLTVSISTGGKSPALARKLRQESEVRFGEEYRILLNLLGDLRNFVLAGESSHQENKTMFNNLLDCAILDWIRDGDWDAVGAHLQKELGSEAARECLEKQGVFSREDRGSEHT